MKKILFFLGLLFVFVGFVLVRTISNLSVAELPQQRQQTGIVSKVETYDTSKFGEVFFFELEGNTDRFWLQTRMEKQPGLKEQLLQELGKGDEVTVFYTSLEGTQYYYDSAPCDVVRVEKGEKTIEGLAFIGGKEMGGRQEFGFYFIGTLIFTVGSALIFIAVIAWLYGFKKS